MCVSKFNADFLQKVTLLPRRLGPYSAACETKQELSYRKQIARQQRT